MFHFLIDWQHLSLNWKLYFLKDFIYLFSERGEGRERRETLMYGCLSYAPYWGPGPQTRDVPWLGTEPVTLWFSCQHSVHWATLARAGNFILMPLFLTHLLIGFNQTYYCFVLCMLKGLAQITPFFNYKPFCYKIISV